MCDEWGTLKLKEIYVILVPTTYFKYLNDLIVSGLLSKNTHVFTSAVIWFARRSCGFIVFFNLKCNEERRKLL